MSCEVFFFTAPWCAPCQQAAPIFSEVTRELNLLPSIVNVDLTPGIADGFGVELLPTVVVADGEKMRGILAGSRPKVELRAFLRSATGEVGPPDPRPVAD